MARRRPTMADFDYDLPAEAIAQRPAEPRDAARLLVATAPEVRHAVVRDLPGLLRAGDVLVANDTRVRPARLRLRKRSGGAAEVLLLEPCGPEPDQWNALVRPGRRLPPGSVLVDPQGDEVVEVGERTGERGRRVRLLRDPAGCASIPLPPYLHEGLADTERYQTVFADRPASVAAPTAGLHLTRELIEACASRGVPFVTLELVVGLDTFRPVTVDDPADHRMHSEAYRIPDATWAACRRARERGGRVVAVGTTTVRALESAAATGRLADRTAMFIRPPYEFAVTDLLLTNFHLPRSTLLLLVEAFTGPRWRELYGSALREGYRFLSFGDAMLLARGQAAA